MGREDKNIKIQEMPNLERPYEKLYAMGSEYLSNAELLAIIIKTGTKDKNAVEIAQTILTNHEYINTGFRFLHKISIKELMQYRGIGKIKAIQLKAVSEIIKRASAPNFQRDIKIKKPADIAEVVMSSMRYQSKEEIKVALIDSKGNLKNIILVQKGSIGSVNISFKDIFQEAIKQDIPRIIVIHNHPSGDPTPSTEDVKFTKEVIKLGSNLGIEVLDHIIIGDGVFQSILGYINN